MTAIQQLKGVLEHVPSLGGTPYGRWYGDEVPDGARACAKSGEPPSPAEETIGAYRLYRSLPEAQQRLKGSDEAITGGS